MKTLPKMGSNAHKALKHREAIAALNDIVNTYLAPSQIHGVGVFALRDIKKGEKMYQNTIPSIFDVPYSKFRLLQKHVRDTLKQFFPYKIFDKRNEPQTFWYPVNSMQAYMNHSDTPNYDPVKDVALKNIKKGEEITENYREIANSEKIFPFLKS